MRPLVYARSQRLPVMSLSLAFSGGIFTLTGSLVLAHPYKRCNEVVKEDDMKKGGTIDEELDESI